MLPSVFSIALALAAQSATSNPPGEVDAARDRAVSIVARALENPPPIQTEYHYECWFAKRGGPDQTSHADLEKWFFAVVAPDGWLVRTIGGGYEYRAVGGDGWTLDREERSAVLHGTILDPHDLASRILHQSEGFNGATVFAKLSAELRECSPSTVQDDGARIVLTYTIPSQDELMTRASRVRGQTEEGPPKPFRYTIEVSELEAPHVVSYEIIYDDAGPGRGVRITGAQWKHVGDRFLPFAVERVAWGPPGKSVERFIRNDAKQLDPAAAKTLIALPPFRAGWTITDARVRLVVKAGSNEIEFENRKLRLKEPLWSLPGDRLPELLESATLSSPSAPSK